MRNERLAPPARIARTDGPDDLVAPMTVESGRMTHDAPPAPPRITRATATTQRGLATASFSLGMWGLLVFWWYPFGMTIATIGVLLGLATLAFGVRAGKDGENLAAFGIFLGSAAIGLAISVYRFMQLAFEESIPRWGWSTEAQTALTWTAAFVAVVGVIAAVYSYRTRSARPQHDLH